MPVKITIIAGLFLLAIGYAAWDYYGTPGIQIPAQQKIPNITFQALSGQEHDLHDFDNRIVLLNFWATWCLPCKVEFPALLELAARESDKLVLIALSVDVDTEHIDPFFQGLPSKAQQQLGLTNVIIGYDPGSLIAQQLGTEKFPETYIIAPGLQQTQKISGITDWTGPAMKNLITRISP